MRILKTDNYVLERIKVKPITNGELEKVQKDMTSTPVPVPLKNIKDLDKDLQEGWLVVTSGAEHDIRVVIPFEYAKNMFKLWPDDDDHLFFVSSNKKYYALTTYLKVSTFENTFPRSRNGRFVIERIYKYHIPNLKDICENEKTFEQWYEKQNFADLLK